MKKTLLVLFTTLAMGTTALAQTAADVAGKYIGDLYISLAQPVGEETEAMPRQKVELVAGEAEGTVDFALHNFALGEMLLGDIELKGIGLTYADGKYSFAKNEPVALSFLGGAIEATASLNHETSYVKDGQLFADIDVVWTNADEPTPIYVRFESIKPCDVSPVVQAYTGDLYISLDEPVNDESEAISGQKVELFEGGAKGTVKFALHNFALGPMLLGDIELDDIIVTYVDGKYGFAENDPVALSFLDGAIEATASLNHETSYVEGGQLFADIDVVWTNADEPTPIYVRFSGKGNDTGLGQAPVAPAAAQAVYTLSGVRVAATSVKQLPKGVYVVGGKKVIVK